MTRLKKILNSYTGSKAVKHTGAGDNVNHPSHYTQGNIECIDAIKEATKHLTGIEAFCVGNVYKYLWRCELKNGDEDVDKAEWYLKKFKAERKLRKHQDK